MALAATMNEQRRESEWSTSGESSRRPSEAVSATGTGRRKASTQTTDDEPPLCAFVVDDDRYVVPPILFPITPRRLIYQLPFGAVRADT
jgi:hypothetical protein